MTTDLAVQSSDDVIAAYPKEYRKADDHPVFDAIAEASYAMHSAYQEAVDYAASQCDILTATDEYLDGIGNRDRGIARAKNELDEDYRTRLFTPEASTTPEAIVSIVNGILAPYTTKQAQYCESMLDRWFVEDGSSVWTAPICTKDTLIGPTYPDRLYPSDATLNDGLYRPNSEPGEALIFDDDEGRQFLLRVPELNDANAPVAFAQDDAETADVGLFVDDGTSVSGVDMAYASNDYLTADETYSAIINSVDKARGHGIRWVLTVDRRL